MSFWSWLTRRPIELDEDDCKEEVRAHLAIDVVEKVADGASSIVRGFVGRGLRLGAMGAAIGTVSAIAAARLLARVLFGVSATDAASFTSALAIVVGGVRLATLIPAWSASRTNPLDALRHR